jgi:hypothetical protein
LNKHTDAEQLDLFLRLFLQGEVPDGSRQRLREYLASSQAQKVPVFWTKSDAEDHRVRTLCYLVLTLPEFQLA